MRLLPFFLLIFSLPLSAQVYKWTDENGNVHFGSRPPPGAGEKLDLENGNGGTLVTEGMRHAESERRKKLREERLEAGRAAAEATRQGSCKLARQRLEHAQTQLTLMMSLDRYNDRSPYWQRKVERWQDRVQVHCHELPAALSGS